MGSIRQRRLVVGVMAAALAITSAGTYLRGRLTAPTPDYNEQMRMARYLCNGTGFVCPVGPERKDPSSWYAPGYIALMAGVMAILGPGTVGSLAVIRLVGIAAMSASFGLYFLVGLRKFGPKVAWTALLLMLLSPSLVFKADEIWDTSLAMLMGAAVLALFVLVQPRRAVWLLASGLACGAAAMVNPCFTLCYPIWVIYAWWQQRPGNRTMLGLIRYAGLVVVGFIVAILPWTIRNYHTFGELFYLRGNLPLELWVGNAPWADGYGDALRGNKPHPVFDEAEAQRMVELGEHGYFHACRRDVETWWRQDKARFAKLSLARIRWFWLGRYYGDSPPLTTLAKMAGVAAPTLLGALGALVVMWKRPNGLVLLASLLVFPLPYYATQVMMRYRLPIEPALLLLGAVGLVGLWTKEARPAGQGSHSTVESVGQL